MLWVGEHLRVLLASTEGSVGKEKKRIRKEAGSLDRERKEPCQQLKAVEMCGLFSRRSRMRATMTGS